MFAMTSAYKVLQNENFRTIWFTTEKNLIIQIWSKTTHRRFSVRTNKYNKKIERPRQVKRENVKFHLKILWKQHVL